MSLIIELSPEIQARLRREANRNGIDTVEYARRLIASNLPCTGETTLAKLMQSWINEDVTDDTDVMDERRRTAGLQSRNEC